MLRFSYKQSGRFFVKRCAFSQHASNAASNDTALPSAHVFEPCRSLLYGPGPLELLDGVVRDAATQLGRQKALHVAPSQQAGNAADYQCNVLPLLQSRDALPAISSSLASACTSSAGGTLCTAVPGERGFLNIRLLDAHIWGHVQACARNGDTTPSPPSRGRALVDCGSPNMGKELHPGHLRSGVIGDTLARVARARGWTVDVVSHVGDAGVPMAIVLWQLLEDGIFQGRGALPALWSRPGTGGTGQEDALSPSALSSAYTRGKAAMKAPPVASRVHATLRAMQSMLGKVSQAAYRAGRLGPALSGNGYKQGATAALEDPALLQYVREQGLTDHEATLYLAWRAVCAASRRGYAPLFSMLQVGGAEAGGSLPEVGEACYTHKLEQLVQELLDRGCARVDEGAVAMFVDGPEAAPLLARKGDGGYLYATTDLAALQVRLQAGYDKVVYVTDSGQAAHFSQVFAASSLAGWTLPCTPPSPSLSLLNCLASHRRVQLQHAGFGVVTGPGGKKLSSRAGGELTLSALLEEGRERMRTLRAALAAERAGAGAAGEGWAGSQLSRAQEEELALHLSSSCIRFYDLLHARHVSYSYDPASVLDVRGKGDSATYVLYARIRLNTLRRSVAAAMTQAGMLRQQDASWAALLACISARSPPVPPGQPPFPPESPPQERALGLAIVALPDALAAVERTLSPHFAAHATLALASAAHAFYTTCRLLPPSTPPAALSHGQWATLARRTTLAAAAEHALTACCKLLGLYVLDEM